MTSNIFITKWEVSIIWSTYQELLGTTFLANIGLGAFFATILITSIIYLLYILIRYFRSQLILKNLPGLPILDGQIPLMGHLHLSMGRRNWKHFEDGHKKLGKYYAFCVGDKLWISTIDSDFIKKFAIDEDVHNRIYRMDVSMEEFETGCIFTAQDEQWNKARMAIALAFS